MLRATIRLPAFLRAHCLMNKVLHNRHPGVACPCVSRKAVHAAGQVGLYTYYLATAAGLRAMSPALALMTAQETQLSGAFRSAHQVHPAAPATSRTRLPSRPASRTRLALLCHQGSVLHVYLPVCAPSSRSASGRHSSLPLLSAAACIFRCHTLSSPPGYSWTTCWHPASKSMNDAPRHRPSVHQSAVTCAGGLHGCALPACAAAGGIVGGGGLQRPPQWRGGAHDPEPPPGASAAPLPPLRAAALRAGGVHPAPAAPWILQLH